MTRKDYQMVADAMKRIVNDPLLGEMDSKSALQALAYELAKEFHCDNERFKGLTFLKACGL